MYIYMNSSPGNIYIISSLQIVFIQLAIDIISLTSTFLNILIKKLFFAEIDIENKLMATKGKGGKRNKVGVWN